MHAPGSRSRDPEAWIQEPGNEMVVKKVVKKVVKNVVKKS
jgi:hypothetical protein